MTRRNKVLVKSLTNWKLSTQVNKFVESRVSRFLAKITVMKNFRVLVCPKDSSSAQGAILYPSTQENLPIPPYQVKTKVKEEVVTFEQM